MDVASLAPVRLIHRERWNAGIPKKKSHGGGDGMECNLSRVRHCQLYDEVFSGRGHYVLSHGSRDTRERISKRATDDNGALCMYIYGKIAWKRRIGIIVDGMRVVDTSKYHAVSLHESLLRYCSITRAVVRSRKIVPYAYTRGGRKSHGKRASIAGGRKRDRGGEERRRVLTKVIARLFRFVPGRRIVTRVSTTPRVTPRPRKTTG